MENQNKKPQKDNKNRKVLFFLFIACSAIGGFFYWHENYSRDSEDNNIGVYFRDTLTVEADSSLCDTVSEQTEQNSSSAKTSTAKKSSSYSYDEDEDEIDDDPEYRKGGKYDPALYHTDYSKDQEARRRRYIDNDGWDDDDGYDEYYGYEHEYERDE